MAVRRARGLFAVLAAVLTVSCSAMVAQQQATPENLKKRAKFDFNCDADRLELTKLGNRAFGVEGCGHRATYVWVQHDEWGNGNWVMNTMDGAVSNRPTNSTPAASSNASP